MIKKNNQYFEAWDGGHCYFRVKVTSPDKINILRSLDKMPENDLKAYREWINERFDISKIIEQYPYLIAAD